MDQVKLPVLVLEEMTALPYAVISFTFRNPENIATLKWLSDHSETEAFAVCSRREASPETPLDDYQALYPNGTIVEIKENRMNDPLSRKVVMEGKHRGILTALTSDADGMHGDIFVQDDLADPDLLKRKAMEAELSDDIDALTKVLPNIPPDFQPQFKSAVFESSLQSTMANVISHFAVDNEDRQNYLKLNDVGEQFTFVIAFLKRAAEIARIRSDLVSKVHTSLDNNQKDYVLREEMRIIGQELGDLTPESEADDFLKQVDGLTASDEVKNQISREIKRFKVLQPGSPDSSMSRAYIETLLAMPWDKSVEVNTDLSEARKVLDRDHYGLNEVKERIIEALSVRIATRGKKGDAPILCLVGPPGTGKTSIARSVAAALGIPYIRVALGGVHDEAEIRGHRRTYVGALPGRIAAGLKTAGVNNPLMLLDEIDKVGGDGFQGDPQAALLEVLDGEQNRHFVDHYIDMETDLSNVLFICTANDLSTISQPLQDRMEIISLSGYTANEKLHIAQEHLVPKQVEKNGLADGQLRFSDNAIRLIAEGYTAEAGVRQLEREIAKICRICVKNLYRNGEIAADKVTVNERNVPKYLGRRKFEKPLSQKEDAVGTVNGLAWTQVGGTTLEVEVLVLDGKQGLVMTGQLGDVMKESAQIALSYVRSISGKPSKYFENHQFHLHVPEGAVKKDGPSAGITLATAFYSAITGRKVRGDVAMTGEITLQGRVLPVGGLKEKLLAAQSAGMHKVIVSKENRPAIEELDAEITHGMTIVYVSTLQEVLREALTEDGKE